MRMKLLLFIFIAVLTPALAHAAAPQGILGLNINISSCDPAAAPPPVCTAGATPGFFGEIACSTMTTFKNGITPLYCNIPSNPSYISAISALMVLYVTLTGVMYVGGITRATKGDLIIRLLKITFIYTLATNPDIYLSLIFQTVLTAPQELVSFVLNQATAGGAAPAAPENFFEYVDKKIDTLFNTFIGDKAETESNDNYKAANAKIVLLGIAVWKVMPGGEAIAFVFFSVLGGWVLTYLTIMVRILVALIALMFLLTLGPLFIPTLLFKPTSYLGSAWIKMMTSFILQIFITVTFLLMIESFFIEFVNNVIEGYEKISNEVTAAATNLDESFNTSVQSFSDDPNNAVDSLKPVTGYTGTTINDALVKFKTTPDGPEPLNVWLPRFFVNLIEMLVIIFSASTFLKIIPQLATSIAGNPNFTSILGGTELGKGKVAELLGGRTGENLVDTFHKRSLLNVTKTP